MLIELIRLVVTLGFTAAGFLVGRAVPDWSSSGSVDPDAAIVLGTVIGAGLGYVLGGLLGRGIRRALDRAPQLVARASGPQLFAGAFGLMAGLIVGVVAGLPLVIFAPTVVGWPVAALLVVVLAAFGGRVFAARAHDLLAAAGLRSRTATRRGPSGGGYLIDSAAAIDGRVLELARAGVLSGEVWVPEFVLDELQGIADSGQQGSPPPGAAGPRGPGGAARPAGRRAAHRRGRPARLRRGRRQAAGPLPAHRGHAGLHRLQPDPGGCPARGGRAQPPGAGRGAAPPAGRRRPPQPQDRT